ncbi:PAS domain-containing sensor histidine kinase [Variovorax sp. KK3]|uniref:hybrid sensor histidine kinase/response regulator n=1 Tax=Variovorax sp. KK3 TaxID=1855728 RepID=UPI00097C67EF|nr:PAS domain S-box protein [Variovorax sp. KK3]
MTAAKDDASALESTARYRAIFESAVDFAIVATTRQGLITDWNSGAEHIFGWSAAEMHGHSAERFFTPEDRASGQIEREMATALAKNRANDERWHLRKDGSRFWASGEMMPLRDQNGEHLGYLKILRDRTAERNAAVKHAADAEFMRGVLASSNDCIKVLDLDAKLEFMSEGGQRIMEVSDFNELRGCHWPDMWSGGAKEDVLKAVEAARAGGIGHFQGPADTAAGNPRHWDVQVTSIPDEHGHPFKLLSISRDITKRRQAELALEELAASLEQQVEERTRERDRAWKLSLDLQVVVDARGIIHAVNDAWSTQLGWSPADLVGKKFTDFVHPDDYQPSAGALEIAADAELPSFENRYRRKDGTWCWFAWVSAPSGDRIYASGRDVTAEKEADAVLAAAQEQLRQSQKMEAVGQLTGGLAHDFNNLLASISGSLELMSRRLQQGRFTEFDRYISVAQASTKRAAALTHRMLAFSRRQTLEPRPTDANKLVRNMEELVRRTIGPEISLEVVGAVGLWNINVDPNQLENALLNLCINARDAMPDGGKLTIETANKWMDERAAIERQLPPGQYVSICVTDTGTGMDAETVRRIFEPFFTTKPIGMGTGLGLSMVYGFATQSGGQVRPYSEVGMGTTMCLYLPRHHGDAVDPRAAPVSSASTQQGHRGTVLVVDDEANVRLVVTEVLADMGFMSLEAEDGQAGLKILQSKTPIDLLISDVGLPGGINGRQLADAGRALKADLKVLFITGYAENAVIGHGHLEPGMQVLTKPFTLDALADRVTELVERAQPK